MLGDNKMTGAIPDGLGALTDVITIDLNNNQFSGQLPTYLGVLDDISHLNLSNNLLEGDFSLIELSAILDRLEVN